MEGFAGSAIQLSVLDKPLHLPSGTALIFTHILNPFGMSWLRRANENNVDLNRNFIANGNYSGAPPQYAAVDNFLNPKSPPSRDFFLPRSGLLFLKYGIRTTLQIVAGGQYEFPKAVFFGGKTLEPELQQYHAFLATQLRSVQNAVAIDVHTGIGRFGKDLLIVERDVYTRMREIFGPRVILSEPRGLPSYQIRGGHNLLVSHALPNADVRFVTQEFGTYNPVTVFHALREENRWHHYGDGSLTHATKQTMKEIFCPRNEQWRQNVLARGREVFEQALQQLGTVRN